MEYEVHESVIHEYATPRGLIRTEFAAGVVTDPSEDERYVLEYVLIPAGRARRVRREKGSE